MEQNLLASDFRVKTLFTHPYDDAGGRDDSVHLKHRRGEHGLHA